MGNRVLMQCYSSQSGGTGPVLYLHDGGSLAPEIARRLAARMVGRGGDLPYSSARLVQEGLAGVEDGNLGVGLRQSERLVEYDSQGDAGVVLIDVDTGHACACFGGYLVTGSDGFPFDPRQEG